MGRYYNGDIEGKFWFGIQSSTSASRFGVEPTQPNYVNYFFDKSDLKTLQEELAYIEKDLGKDFKILQEFFKEPRGFNDETIADLLNTTQDLARAKVQWYADYELGKKIEACIIEQGSCDFDAEL